MDSTDCGLSARFGILVGHYCPEIKVTARSFLLFYTTRAYSAYAFLLISALYIYDITHTHFSRRDIVSMCNDLTSTCSIK